MIWLNATDGRETYLVDHGYTLFGLCWLELPREVENEDRQANESVSMHRLTSSVVMLLEGFNPQTFQKGARKVRTKMMSKAKPCLLKPLKLAAESEF